METITNLGTIGTTDGIQRPLDISLRRDGAVWDLTGYTTPVLKAWDARTKTARTLNGALTVASPATSGVVEYTPGAADPLFSAGSGLLETRATLIPAGGGVAEPSDLFRFSIDPALG